MKKYIIVILAFFSSYCFASLNPEASKTYNNFDVTPVEQQMAPEIKSYVTNIENQLEHDVALLNSSCDNEIRDREKRIIFKQCFENLKNKFHNNIFKSATSLSLMFIDDQENNQQIINDFIETYQSELTQIIGLSNQMFLPSEPFKKVMVKLFNEILINSYKNIQIIISGDNLKAKEVEAIFSEITNKMNKISDGY